MTTMVMIKNVLDENIFGLKKLSVITNLINDEESVSEVDKQYIEVLLKFNELYEKDQYVDNLPQFPVQNKFKLMIGDFKSSDFYHSQRRLILDLKTGNPLFHLEENWDLETFEKTISEFRRESCDKRLNSANSVDKATSFLDFNFSIYCDALVSSCKGEGWYEISNETILVSLKLISTLTKNCPPILLQLIEAEKFLMVKNHLFLGNYDIAEKILIEIQGDSKWNREVLLGHALIEFKRGNYSNAMKWLNLV